MAMYLRRNCNNYLMSQNSVELMSLPPLVSQAVQVFSQKKVLCVFLEQPWEMVRISRNIFRIVDLFIVLPFI